jgi:hypothetical protein
MNQNYIHPRPPVADVVLVVFNSFSGAWGQTSLLCVNVVYFVQKRHKISLLSRWLHSTFFVQNRKWVCFTLLQLVIACINVCRFTDSVLIIQIQMFSSVRRTILFRSPGTGQQSFASAVSHNQGSVRTQSLGFSLRPLLSRLKNARRKPEAEVGHVGNL